MRTWMLASALLALTAACTTETTSPSPLAPTVKLTGTVYGFNTPDPIVGAKVSVAELPDLVTTTDAQGVYVLAVPDGKPVTPFVTADTFHTMHLQTFTTAGKGLEHVNFQTPDNGIFGVLAQLVGVDPNAPVCHIVSTVSTKDIQGLRFEAFTKFGAHGVAGATASATPTLPAPIYFNKQVVPDAKQVGTSDDGGVLWVNVPAGVYTISATHPTRKFASFTATCVAGRLVNANPPWGLHEL